MKVLASFLDCARFVRLWIGIHVLPAPGDVPVGEQRFVKRERLRRDAWRRIVNLRQENKLGLLYIVLCFFLRGIKIKQLIDGRSTASTGIDDAEHCFFLKKMEEAGE